MNNKPEGFGYNPESNKELKDISKEIYEAVENSSLEFGEFIEIGGFTFYVMYFDELNEDEPQAWYSANSSVADVDVYIYEGLSEEDKKRSMFHEMMEIIAYNELPEVPMENLAVKSHEVALEEEIRHYGQRKKEMKID